ncbi:MAG: PIN domain nuclease, partial [Thermodesulfobacteriota bacterium]|nr:PIN domain nuclease [Thermodesulfobacteriota bacterium]
MKVLVDTPIWSYALRSKRAGYEQQVREFETLIADQRVLLIGPIRQEVLSGYSEEKKFDKLN